jgi:hypothetical protein
LGDFAIWRSAVSSPNQQITESPNGNAGVAQLVERQPSKLQVAGSNLVSRSAHWAIVILVGVVHHKVTKSPDQQMVRRCSSVVEHFLGKEEVVSSILINGSGKSRWILKSAGSENEFIELLTNL